MIIIPMAQSTADSQRARQLLKQVKEQRQKVTLVVFGDTEQAGQIAARADVRASGHPARQVVWLQDLTVLDGDPELAALKQVAIAHGAAFFTLDFALSSAPSHPSLTGFADLELGFANALRGMTR